MSDFALYVIYSRARGVVKTFWYSCAVIMLFGVFTGAIAAIDTPEYAYAPLIYACLTWFCLYKGRTASLKSRLVRDVFAGMVTEIEGKEG